MSQKASCKLVCPKCHKEWAEVKYEFDTPIKAKDVKILRGKRTKLRDGDSLACSLCGHEHTNFDVMLAIAEGGGIEGK